jgi:DNA-binding GntR family transcriptional regulator
MTGSTLSTNLAEQIALYLQTEKLSPGQPLVERRLAERFRVSRTPVRNALKRLHQLGAVAPQEGGGYQVADIAAIDFALSGATPDDEETAYRRIAEDRVSGALPDRITENELLRRYGVTRGKLTAILRRMANEGWIERLPGHGWEFLPVLTSLQAYEDSYRYRMLIEPAALLEPNWSLNRPVIQRCRDEQQWLADGGIWKVSDSRLFEMNSGMHEAIMECCGNAFFIDGLKRVDRLRRLIDYRQMLDRDDARNRCLEHIELIDLVLAERNQDASRFMQRHLSELSGYKTQLRSARTAD